MAVSVLMLQPLTIESGPSGCSAEEKTFRFVVSCCPDEIADALKTKHRIIEIKGNHVDSQIGVRGSGGNKRGHRTGFGNPFFEDLAVFGFVVIEQSLTIDRLVELAFGRIDADLTK